MPKKRSGNEKIYRYGKIYQYDLNGNFIAEFESYSQCCDLCNIRSGVLWDILNNKRCRQSKGFVYSYTFYMKYPIELIYKTKRNVKRKIVYQYDLEGNFIAEFESITIAAKATKTNRTQLRLVCEGKYKTANNFLWSYNKSKKLKPYVKVSHRNKKVLQYDLDGNLIKKWKNVTEANFKFTNKKTSTINQCVIGGTKTAYGFIWKYENE
jgi:hypothetical protein